ncbi:MAG: preprotein translocase subunit YajC [Elusimicrobiota bacterium]|jgi:preprotein translocase subunit YajC|nr:preprotein translocase subunit YajC [Elusimicrobiota bacterium]
MEPTTAAAAAAPAAATGMNGFFFLMIAFILIFMVLSMRTNKKRMAQQQQLIGSLKKGDKVIILNGIVATIDGFKDNLLEVKLSEGNKVTILPSAVISVYNAQPAQQEQGAKK